MIIRKIHDNELMEARNISSLCFEWSHDTKEKTPEEYFKEVMEHPEGKTDFYYQDTWGAFTDKNEMMANLSAIPFVVVFDGHQMPMTGIGGVCTYPQFRRCGAVRSVFEKMLPQLYEEGKAFTYLYAFSEQFYGKFGYYPAPPAVAWTFDMKTIPDERYDGTFALLRNQNDLKGFEEAYQKYALRYNMMVIRDEHDWGILNSANPFKDNKFAYLYRDAEGCARGYLVFETKKEDDAVFMHCSEMVFENFAVLKILMSFAKSFASDYDFVRFRAPVCLPLEHFCKDYSQSDSKRELIQNGMLRVICVEEVLKNAAYRGFGEAAVQIEDTAIEQNNRIFHIKYREGAAAEVTVHPLQGAAVKADVIMNIGVFSAAVSGRYSVDEFAYLDGIRILGDAACLSDVFYKKPFFISNYF